MSELDEAAVKKLKVAELRAELQSRGLDSKGNKPVLVERLLEAISNVDDEKANGEEPMEETAETSQEEVAEAKEETAPQESQLDVQEEVPKLETELTQDNETASESTEVVDVPAPVEEKPSEEAQETVQAPEPTPSEDKESEKREGEAKVEEPMETSQETAATSEVKEGWFTKIKCFEINILFAYMWLALISLRWKLKRSPWLGLILPVLYSSSWTCNKKNSRHLFGQLIGRKLYPKSKNM